MEITNDLVQKFFENKCDPEEFEAVANYLEQHPEQRASWLGIEEWNAIDPLQPAPDLQPAEILEQLKRRFFTRSSLIRRLRVPAVAASFLLIIGGWVWMTTRRAGDKAALVSGKPGNHRQTTAPAIWQYRTNATGQPQTFALPDGSRMKLYAHSSLYYTDSFGIARRDGWLDGEADFSVKKDGTHPFTIYSGVLATTALGTSFGVKGYKTTGNVAVKLYTGRVMVRAVKPLAGWSKDLYLVPGQQVLYDNRRMLASISTFTTPKANPVIRQPGGDPKDLVFNNTPLKEVFNQLSIQYHRKINYTASDLTGMNFTGLVPRSDSLIVFLRLLANMNNLEVQEKEPVLVITRHSDH